MLSLACSVLIRFATTRRTADALPSGVSPGAAERLRLRSELPSTSEVQEQRQTI